MSVKDIKEKIAVLEKELREEEQKLADLQGMDQSIRVAEMLHERLCHHDHVERCGWYYEDWSNWKNSSDKKRYLKMAEELLSITNGNEEFIEQFVEIIERY